MIRKNIILVFLVFALFFSFSNKVLARCIFNSSINSVVCDENSIYPVVDDSNCSPQESHMCNKASGGICGGDYCGSNDSGCCLTAGDWSKNEQYCMELGVGEYLFDWAEYDQQCSTADKCISGEFGLRSGGCACGEYSPSIYKQCCNNVTGALSTSSCVGYLDSDDDFYPPEGVCPSGTHEHLLATDGACCTPVNGGWSAFSACVGGVQTRTCNNPTPSCGGSSCVGSDTQACCPAAETCIESKYGTYLPDGNCNQVLCSADPITMYFCLNTAYGSCSATSSQYTPDATGQTSCNTNLDTYFPGVHVGDCYAVQSSCVSNCVCVPNDCAASTYVGSTCWNGCATVAGTKSVPTDPSVICTPWTCPSVNGVCGSSFPGQCITGTNSGATLSGHYYNWTCLGSN